MSKTVKGMLLHAVDLLTASIGWIEMSDAHKAKQHIRDSIGVLMEAESQLEVLMHDLEGNLQGIKHDLLNPPESMQSRLTAAKNTVIQMQKSLDKTTNDAATEEKKKPNDT